MAITVTKITIGQKQVGQRITPDGRTIGFVARGMREGGRHSSAFLKQQHADCLLPYGKLIGFSPTNRPGSGGTLGAYFDLNVEGAVVPAERLEAVARNNFDPDVRNQATSLIRAERAKVDDYMSGVLLIEAPQRNVELFIENWEKLSKAPKNFYVIGGNCATRAKDIFVASQIIPHVSFLIDTPAKLFAHLTQVLSCDCRYKITSFLGYFGFEKRPEMGIEKKQEMRYDLIVLN